MKQQFPDRIQKIRKKAPAELSDIEKDEYLEYMEAQGGGSFVAVSGPRKGGPSFDVAPNQRISYTKEDGLIFGGNTEQAATPKSAPKSTDDRMSEGLAKRVASKLQNPAGNPTMTVPEACHALTKKKATIYRWIEDGKLDKATKGRILTASVVRHLKAADPVSGQ